MNNDLISRSALLGDIGDIPNWTGVEPILFPGATYEAFRGMVVAMENFINHVKNAPAVDAVEVDVVAEMFFAFTGDLCPCNFNNNDEWLPEVCELINECPHPEDALGCWKQYIKHYRERREDG